MNKKVHLNCDMAEGVGNEVRLMPYLNACNIACGAHAGNDTLIKETIQLAMQYQLEIGAHPGFPDPENFGRKKMDITFDILEESIRNQILKVKTITQDMGGRLYHIKPHGALYNIAAIEVEYAQLLIKVVQEIDDQLLLYVPYKSVIAEMAQGTLNTMIEGFADRRYMDTYTLTSRDLDDALITVPKAVYDQVKMIISGQLKTLSQNVIPFEADTLCIHGDTPNAESILKYVTSQLKLENFDV